MRRYRSSTLGEDELLRSLGIFSCTSPSMVETSRSRESFRWVVRAFAAFDLDGLGRLDVDQRLVEESDHLANQIAALVALKCAEHLGQVKIMVGHRSIPFVPCYGHIEKYSGDPSSRRTEEITPPQGTSTLRTLYVASGQVVRCGVCSAV